MPKNGDINHGVRDAEVQGITQDIVIQYNPATQAVALKFDPAQFKTFEFILGILEMAKLWTQHMKIGAIQVVAQQQAQQMMMAAQQEAALRGVIKGH